TPSANPKACAKSAVFSEVSNTPPAETNFDRFSTPCHPRPGRMSSVCANGVMFGVNGVTFHGIGFLHVGIPSTIDCGLALPGPNTITSYFELRFVVFAAS